jgi:hypothetical protein
MWADEFKQDYDDDEFDDWAEFGEAESNREEKE